MHFHFEKLIDVPFLGFENQMKIIDTFFDSEIHNESAIVRIEIEKQRIEMFRQRKSTLHLLLRKQRERVNGRKHFESHVVSAVRFVSFQSEVRDRQLITVITETFIVLCFIACEVLFQCAIIVASVVWNIYVSQIAWEFEDFSITTNL